MSTRSTTKFIAEDDTILAALYRQMDGYPEGHGKELAEFLVGIRRINHNGPAGTANGISCLAAQVIAHFKTEPGGFYLVHPGGTEEWNYEVRENENGSWTLSVKNGDDESSYFYGTPQEFLDKVNLR